MNERKTSEADIQSVVRSINFPNQEVSLVTQTEQWNSGDFAYAIDRLSSDQPRERREDLRPIYMRLWEKRRAREEQAVVDAIETKRHEEISQKLQELTKAMKDTDLRGLVLKKYYEKRRSGGLTFLTMDGDFKDLPQPLDFDQSDVHRATEQLAEVGLLEWHPFKGFMGRIEGVQAKITARGVDVIEGNTRSPISVTINNVSVHNSQGVVVGDNNVQKLELHHAKILSAINDSNATENEKAEAKSLFARIFENPTLASAIGALIGLVK